MWSQLFLCALVGFAAASNHGWQHNMQYVYKVEGRTLTGLHEIADQYAGIVLKAKLIVLPESDGQLMAKIVDPQYAQIHTQLPEGWQGEIPQSKLHYQQLQLSEKPFEIILKKGVVKDIVVDREVKNWEANIIRSIVSQLQLDTLGEQVIKAHVNQLPEEGSNNAVFKTMEDTITGKHEILYDISPLPKYVLQSQPWLAPMPELKKDGEYIEIVKSTNFSRSEERPGYYYGLGGMGHFEPNTNHMGDFFLRSSVSRAIITGDLKDYVIQSINTVNKIIISPTLNNEQKGMVVSQLNFTLSDVKPVSQSMEKPHQRQMLESLTYSYETPFSGSYEAKHSSRRQEQEYMYSSEERQHYRSRRSVQSSESSSVSDEEEWAQDAKLDQAPQSPLLPLYTGYKGKSIKSSNQIDVVKIAQKFAREIGHEIKSPEHIPKEATLSKYVILSSVARIMSLKEMKQVSEELYVEDEKHDKIQAWYVYRDVISETGTGPALLTIKEWIKTKKIRYEEAAEILSSMAQSVRQPTIEYMREFFDLATKEQEVLRQHILNDTAILSFTSLARKVYLDKLVGHNQFPVHSFGKFRTESALSFLENDVLSYLKDKLHESVQKGDSHKILVYIRALGNVPCQKMLAIFEPYLEGEKQISQFQRLQMVLAMDKLVKVHPKIARSVLYKIYQNSGEQQEIRVAAVYQLMRTTPSASMLQRMAEYTNVDVHEQVNAAVKSSIESAAELEGEEFAELAENARVAQPLLTKELYGMHYSGNYLRSYVEQEMNLFYKKTLQVYGSEDSLIPKGFKYALRFGLGGTRRQVCLFSAIVSSIDELTNVLERQTKQYEEEQEQHETKYNEAKQHQFSSESIAKMLNIQSEEREQLEGSILLQLAGGATRYFTFNNRTIERLPSVIREIEDLLREGKDIDFTKFLNRYEVAISFPTVMALPFIYTLDAPTLLHVQGQVRATAEPKISSGDYLNKPQTITAHSEIRAVVSTRIEAKIGFITPYDHQEYVSGYDKNMQVYLPIKSQVEINVEKSHMHAQVQLIEPEKNVQLLHYSTWPYTAMKDILKLEPLCRPEFNKIIYTQETPQTKIHTVLGKQTAMAFRVNYISEQRFLDALWLQQQFSRNDIITNMFAPFFDETILHTNINIEYDADNSIARKYQFKMGFHNEYHTEEVHGSQPELSKLSQLPHQSKDRQEEISKMVGVGIRNVNISAVDVVFEFDGHNKVEYTATAALASSNVDELSRVLVFLKKHSSSKPYEVAFSAESRIRNTNGLDFLYALKYEPKIISEMKLAFGQDHQSATKVELHAKFEQSQARKDYLKHHPRAEECHEEMQEGNKQLSACANMTVEANLMDRVHLKLKYDNLSEKARNVTHKLYNGLRYWGFYNLDENVIDPEEDIPKDELELIARFDEDLEAVNVTLKAHKLKATFDQIRINNLVRQLVVLHPVFPVTDRLWSSALEYDTYRPYCVVDKTAANTFDNKTYPIDLDQFWHVMLQYVPTYAREGNHQLEYIQQQKEMQREQFVVLVRDSQGRQSTKEVKMTIRTPETEGKLFEIELKPVEGRHTESLPKVLVNGEEISYDIKKSADFEDGFIQIYGLPNGEVKVEVIDNYYIIYDGERVKLTVTHDKFRDAIRGLCGTYNGNEYNDFLTPRECILEHPHEFAATYALHPKGQVAEYLSRAEKSKCYSEEPIFVNVISNTDAGRSHQKYHSSSKKNSHSKYSDSDSQSCTKHQTRYVIGEDENEICFTIRPLPVCKNSCSSYGMIEKSVEVHCVQRTNVAELWKKQIEKGASPDFSQKSASKVAKIRLPKSCSQY